MSEIPPIGSDVFEDFSQLEPSQPKTSSIAESLINEFVLKQLSAFKSDLYAQLKAVDGEISRRDKNVSTQVSQVVAAPEETMPIIEQVVAAPEETMPIIEQVVAAPEETMPIIEQVVAAPEETMPIIEQVVAAPEETMPIIEQVVAAPEETMPIIEQVVAAPEETTPIADQVVLEPSKERTQKVPLLKKPHTFNKPKSKISKRRF